MGVLTFGLTRSKPSPSEAKKWDAACRDAGGYGLIECNRRRGETPGINHGRYQAWFEAPCRGEPFDSALINEVRKRIG